MLLRLLAGVTLAVALATPPPAKADPVPPACVVVDQPPVHLQAGYAPTGPEGCTRLP